MDPSEYYADTRFEGLEEVGVDEAGFRAMRVAPFDANLGLRFDLISPSRLEATVPVGGHLLQPYGLVHGGVYASIVETLGSFGGVVNVLGRGEACVGVHNATDFLRSAREGDVLHAVAEPVHLGRLQHLWHVEVSRGSDGRPCAVGMLRLQVLPAERVAG